MSAQRHADDFVNWNLRRGIYRPATARGARYILTSLADAVPDIQDLTAERIEAWLDAMPGVTDATKANRLSKARAFCRWLYDNSHLDRDPSRQVPRPRIPDAVPRALDRDAVASLLAVCPDTRARVIVLLETQEMLRRAEVATLQVADVDLRGGAVFVREGKGGRQRMVPLSGETASAVRAYLSQHPAVAGPLIRSYQYPRRPLTPDHVGRLVASWMVDAGLKRAPWDGVSGHALRHTGASDVLEESNDLRGLQQLLGHRSLTSTEVYLRRTAPGRLRTVAGGRRYGGQISAV